MQYLKLFKLECVQNTRTIGIRLYYANVIDVSSQERYTDLQIAISI